MIGLKFIGVDNSMFKHISDIHGADHVNRVIYYSIMLCREMGWEDILPECWAAAYAHDLWRSGDGSEQEHGPVAAANVLERWKKGELEIFRDAGVLNIEAVTAAIFWHSIPDENTLQLFPDAERVWKILKDADALDRVRFGNVDTDMLRLPITASFIPKAKTAWEMSEGTEWPETYFICQNIFQLKG